MATSLGFKNPNQFLETRFKYLRTEIFFLRLLEGLCFSFYNSLTLLFSEIDGRFYGGGVLELTPNEFKGLPLVYHEPSKDEFRAFVGAHKGNGNVTEQLADFGDKWLKSEIEITDDQLAMLRNAWKIARDHRLRHGSKREQILTP